MKISMIGTIDETHSQVNGQFDRTEAIMNSLSKCGYDVRFSNMMNWQRNPLKVFVKIVINYFRSDAVLMMSSLNGVRLNLFLLSYLWKIKNKPAFQIALGGKSNCELLKKEIKYRNIVKKLRGVFVEVAPMVDEYHNLGIEKVFYIPNCKDIDKTSERYTPEKSNTFRFCTYSRVTPEKGIQDAIDAVERLNIKKRHDFCTLDIYGTYLDNDKQWFANLMKKSSNAIKYKNRIDRNESISTLGKYDVLLFPSKNVGEGIPGGLIDCYEAGLPIIACDISYMSSLVQDGETGYIYKDDKSENLDDAILRYTDGLSPEDKVKMRENCIQKAMEFDTTTTIQKLIDTFSSLLHEN